MAQYARPIADITVGSWGTTPLWDKLDEVTADNATTQIQSSNRPSNDTFEVRLGSVTDPLVSNGHIVRIRMYGSTSHTWSAYLYQGTTLVKTLVSGAVPPASFTTYSYTLTAGEADSITNYADLHVRIVANGSANGREYVTWIEMELPDLVIAKSGTASISGTTHVLGTVKKIALILAAVGILGHVLGTGFKAYPVVLHGGGAATVAGKKSVGYAASISGGWNESQVAPETYDSFERPTENPINPPWVAINASGGDWPVTGTPMLLYVGAGSFTAAELTRGAAYDSNGPFSFNQWVELSMPPNSTYPNFMVLRYDPATNTGLFVEWARYTITLWEWVNGTRYNIQSATPGPDYTMRQPAPMRCEVRGNVFRAMYGGVVEWQATLVVQYASKPGYAGIGVERGGGGWRAVSDYRAARIPSGASGKKGTSNNLYVITGADVFDQLAGSFLGDDPEWSDGGSFKVKDGGAYCEIQTGGENLFLGGIVPPVSEFVQSVIVGEGDNSFIGLMLRDGHYRVWFRVMFGDVVVWRDGSLLGQFSYSVQVGDTVRVEAKGSIFQAMVNGVVAVTFDDATYPAPGRGGIVGIGPSSGVGGVPAQLDDFIVGYNYGFTIRGGGNILIWSEDHYGDAAISGNGTVASTGGKGRSSAALVSGSGSTSTQGMKGGIPSYLASYQDDFNRTNEDPIQPPWWVPLHWRPTAKIVSNELQLQYWYTSGVFQVETPVVSDQTVSATVKSLPYTSQEFGLVGRAAINADAVDYVYIALMQYPDSIAVFRKQKSGGGDSTTTITLRSWANLPFSLAVGQRWSARFSGNTLYVSMNGTAVLGMDLGFTQSGVGGVGVSGAGLNTPVRFDDYSISIPTVDAIIGGGTLATAGRKDVLCEAYVTGGGTIYASAREEAYRAVSIHGGGVIVLAFYKEARSSAHVAGNGTVAPTISMDALGQPIVTGNGSLVVEFYPSHTAEYVWALVRGGGEITVTYEAAHSNVAVLSGGGGIDVQWVRSWPYIPTTPPGVDDATALIVKIHLSYCGRAFGTDPCFATGEPCYKTWPTCKYIPAYQDVGKEYKFCLATIPQVAPDARPYILDIKWLPTEITTNLTVNGRIVLDMADEEDADVSIDPYWSQRASHPGTFWKKMLARNKNYKGRIVEVFEGRIDATESNYVKRWVGRLSNVKLAQGKVTLESTDLLKDLTKIEVPPKTNAKTAAAIDAGYLQGVILTDDVDIFPSSGYVRIDDEIIRYESKDDVTKQLSTLTRAQFGTVDVAHNEKSKAQPVRYFEPKSGFDHLLDMMLVDAGMSADNVDLDAFAYWKEWPCRDINFTAVVSEPVKLSDLFFEVVDLLDCKAWVAESLKVTIRRNIQNHPGREYYPITDDSEIKDRSGAVDLNEASRVTRISYFWHKLPLGNIAEYSSYRRLDIAVDPDAETNYDGVIEKVVLSRWIDPTIGWEELIGRFVRNIGLRRVTRQRDAQPIITVEVPPKESDIATGDYCILSTDELLESDGTPLSRQRYQIIRRERKGNVFALKMIRLAQRRICIIAPNGTPDYGSATEAQKEYGFVSDSGAKMSDGTEGYFIW